MTDGILSPMQPDDLDRERDENEPQDEGHQRLLEDLEELLTEAEECEFHDFENKKYAAPKIALKSALSKIIARVEQGWYDN